jgi:hypothetical protein
MNHCCAANRISRSDEDSGVGTQVIARGLNGDGIPDIVVGNKKGNFLFLSQEVK